MVESQRKPSDIWTALIVGAIVALFTTAVDWLVGSLAGHSTIRMAAMVAMAPFITGIIVLLNDRKDPKKSSLVGQSIALAIVGFIVVSLAGHLGSPVLVFLLTTLGLAISAFGGTPLRRAYPVVPTGDDR